MVLRIVRLARLNSSITILNVVLRAGRNLAIAVSRAFAVLSLTRHFDCKQHRRPQQSLRTECHASRSQRRHDTQQAKTPSQLGSVCLFASRSRAINSHQTRIVFYVTHLYHFKHIKSPLSRCNHFKKKTCRASVLCELQVLAIFGHKIF